jgi:hypothetical protein
MVTPHMLCAEGSFLGRTPSGRLIGAYLRADSSGWKVYVVQNEGTHGTIEADPSFLAKSRAEAAEMVNRLASGDLY